MGAGGGDGGGAGGHQLSGDGIGGGNQTKSPKSIGPGSRAGGFQNLKLSAGALLLARTFLALIMLGIIVQGVDECH